MFRRLANPGTAQAGKRFLSSPPTQNPLQASFLRGGTSKGIYLHRSHLPSNQAEWTPIFLGIMGSPDPTYGRQLNGMGGGVSSLSKVCVVGPASGKHRANGVDVEYTFVQVGIRDSTVDYSGNCGNLSSMIGVYALDAAICKPSRVDSNGQTTVRSFNTNTSKIIDTSFPLSPSGVATLDRPQTEVAGVHGKASQIVLDFVDPSGARTGKLLPTGSPVNTLDMASIGRAVKASLVDATNPSVFVSYDELSEYLPLDAYFQGSQAAEEKVAPVLEEIRQAGAKAMGLDPSAKAQPKIAILSRPKGGPGDSNADIVVHALSMGVLHKAVPMTLGLCLGVAAKTEGTLAWDIVKHSGSNSSGDLVRILHPGGVVEVGAEHRADGTVASAKVVRTGRRLMVGSVYW
ncbi:DUF453 domain-containing protein [Ephemerocybe angulata]|uniref:DUF453 domain-containing protein n=1 Tax=Ephemerocybe angulata TaxID=980116 RepID=A0A8H6M9M5_9AGAR|nr:DUF453 domain-containing protein [Tulosesus angulatus]KAF6761028.1 DUF453 domain-containing protein [Tulosesus angulatus]